MAQPQSASVPLARPSSRSHFKSVHRVSIDPNQDPIHLSVPSAAPSTPTAASNPSAVHHDWSSAGNCADLDVDGDGDEHVVEGDVMMSHLPLEPESYVGRHAEVQRLIQLINTHRYAQCPSHDIFCHTHTFIVSFEDVHVYVSRSCSIASSVVNVFGAAAIGKSSVLARTCHFLQQRRRTRSVVYFSFASVRPEVRHTSGSFS